MADFSSELYGEPSDQPTEVEEWLSQLELIREDTQAALNVLGRCPQLFSIKGARFNLAYCNLSGARLIGLNLGAFDFTKCILFKAKIIECVFGSVSFHESCMWDSEWQGSAHDARFSYTDLRYSSFQDLRFHNCDFENTKFSRSRIDADFENCRFSEARFRSAEGHVSFRGAQILDCDFVRSSLQPEFVNCKITSPNFNSANLNGSEWVNCICIDPEFAGAWLGGADFSKMTVAFVEFLRVGWGASNTKLPPNSLIDADTWSNDPKLDEERYRTWKFMSIKGLLGSVFQVRTLDS